MPVRSPCVSVCVLDENDICTGCHRSATEITRWTLMDEQERREVIAAARERNRAVNPFAR
jgi:hypothetical protein